MDSKLMRKTAFLAFSVIILIVAAVLVINRGQSRTASVPEVSVNDAREEIITEGGMVEGADLSAFMRDETFFDKEQMFDSVLAKSREANKALSMIATSVEKDLRIQIVNNLGIPAAGHSFFVDVLKTGTDGEETKAEQNQYKDLDQDGIIYIGGLKAGDYMISLQPVQGYEISDVAMRVTVKDKVEYKIIDDISLLVKTEDEIDASVEDTGVNEAGEDVDGTEDNKMKQPDGNTRLGIDVSKWNKEIDWKKVKDAGISFAIIRLGYRGSSSGVLVEDPYFVKNVEGAMQNNIPIGLYFFTQAVNEVEAVEEASMVISLSREYNLDYPVFIDTEGAGGNGRADNLDVQGRTAVCEAFCKTIESADLDAGVYASRNWLNQKLETNKLSNYTTWLAEYRNEPKYEGKYQLWQYTSNGKIDGIEGRVDLNLSYLGY